MIHMYCMVLLNIPLSVQYGFENQPVFIMSQAMKNIKLLDCVIEHDSLNNSPSLHDLFTLCIFML